MSAWSRFLAGLRREDQLQEAARIYASALLPGDRIDASEPEVAPLVEHLPAAVADRKMTLDRIPGGWVVQRAAPAPIECCMCGTSWFHPDCGHGIGTMIDLGSPSATRWLQQTVAKG